ncbi:RICIN domain-containing protein [Micrococcales bacterium 31B]|nr:RICIN domain-containing protein [Micrococcales bacterium 31B]
MANLSDAVDDSEGSHLAHGSGTTTVPEFPSEGVLSSVVTAASDLNPTGVHSLPGPDIPVGLLNLGQRQWLATEQGAPVSREKPTSTSMFTLEPVASPGNSLRVRSRAGLCLTAVTKPNGATLTFAACRDARAQQFESLGPVSGGIVLQSALTGTALTAGLPSAPLLLAPVSGAPQQRWALSTATRAT